MYAAAGGASLAGRKARQHGRHPAPPSPRPHSPPHPAPTGVRAYSCQHWESRLAAPLPSRVLSARFVPHTEPCDVVECAAGRAAWQEAAAIAVGEGGAAGGAARRCSVPGDHPTARRDPRAKWHRKNRVRDASYGSSSESDCEEQAPGEPWGVARLLYAGLSILALGLVVYFVGTGDKGFKTPALRLVGPSLIVAGLACCLLRIIFCIFAKPCCRRPTLFKENRRLGVGEGEQMPLARARRSGPAQCSPARRLDASSCDVSSLSSGEEDERLRRYRTAVRAPPVSVSAPAHLHQATVQQISMQQKQETVHQKQESVSSGPGPPPTPIVTTAPTLAPGIITNSGSPGILGHSGNPGILGHSGTAGVTGNSATGSRRPPPRNVSFAGGPDGELVLSPAQLRS